MIKNYIIKYKSDVADLNIDNDISSKYKLAFTKRFSHCLNGALVKMNENQLERLKNDDNVEFVEEDLNVSIAQKPKINATEVTFVLSSFTKPLWYQTLTNTQTTSVTHASINCYVVDTGISSTHSEFRTSQVFLDYCAIKGIRTATDDNGHGTKVASVIGGRNIGVANNITLHAIKVLDSTGNGSVSNVISGLDWIIKNKKSNSIINMSLEASYSAILNSAVAKCISSGIFVICAAGNGNTVISTVSPASVPAIYPIGAFDSTLTKASFSNFNNILNQDLLTFMPGVAITCAFMDSSNLLYALSDGTSFSSPIVSGIIAKILLAFPTITKTQLDTKLNSMEIINKLSNIPSGSINQYIVYK